jgi:4-hydroxybenzoate polyprenyltransferase
MPIIFLLRPHQWLKNLMLFFPPFLSGALFHPGMLAKGIIPFFAFCWASSAAYVFNDIFDRESDSQHPKKRFRPLPSGMVTKANAYVLFGTLFVGALIFAWSVSYIFLTFVLLYLSISLAYSLRLKHLPIVDVFCISLGFVLRLYAGGEAFGVHISDWLFLTVFLLAIFLSVGKRFSERRSLGSAAGGHRRTLEEYPDGFLESAMYLSGAAVLVTYAIYAISKPLLVYTVPLCLFGLLRYLMKVKSGGEGDPTEALVKDVPLLIVSLLWAVLVAASVYQ